MTWTLPRSISLVDLHLVESRVKIDIEGAFAINGIWGLSLARRRVLRHGDARTRSAAVTAPSGGLLSVEAVGRVATQQLLHVSIIVCFQSSRSQTPVRFFYLVKQIIFYQLSTCARYPTHRECPRYK